MPIDSFEEACRKVATVEELRNMCEWPAEFWMDGSDVHYSYTYCGKG